ncbi:hypothetical protein BDN70DRAFT_907091 [Pholiota conissans]|uniref:Methyltransferase-domain-containing protein n=1 Tax=Pholiota conissans TaxID=109636 RepID=A0A9P5YXT1_9AGAR|nr:hypothetical protein BDN70DRAFT_907091 [Pholiota conissans]
MFFYISFLRPPPVQAGPYGTISITPQISNDLRTESYTSAQDLYFSWSLHSPPHPKGPQTTRPTKFTTYRPSSAYKELPIPVPPGVREGQRWCLIITALPQSAGASNLDSVDLSAADVGASPFPVMSMPIAFIGRGSKGAAKQEMIERTFLVPCRGDADSEEGGGKEQKMLAALTFTEKTSFDLDKKIWDSGIGLSAWLVHLHENPNAPGSNPRREKLRDALFAEEPRRILELGAGIGMLSIAFAVMRSRPLSSEKVNDRIIATDIDSAMPLLEENIAANSGYFQSTKPEAKILDWDDEGLPEDIQALKSFDAIVMADVTYNTASFPSLTHTLSKLARLGPKAPAILLGYKERDESERTFWSMMADLGIDFEKIGERAGAGGAPVEIWLGSVRQ